VDPCCKALRPRDGTFFGDPARGSYLGVAFVAPGRQPEWDAWVVREMQTITAEGRLFPHREHVHTAVYRCKTAHGRVLDGRFAGVIAIATKRENPASDITCTHQARARPHHRLLVRSPPHQLVLAYCTDDPLATFDRITMPAAVGFASPFLATIPDTDAYTEDCSVRARQGSMVR